MPPLTLELSLSRKKKKSPWVPWGWQGIESPDRLILDFVLLFLSHFKARKKMSLPDRHVALESDLQGRQNSEAWNENQFRNRREWSCLIWQVLAEWQQLASAAHPSHGVLCPRAGADWCCHREAMLLETTRRWGHLPETAHSTQGDGES